MSNADVTLEVEVIISDFLSRFSKMVTPDEFYLSLEDVAKPIALRLSKAELLRVSDGRRKGEVCPDCYSPPRLPANFDFLVCSGCAQILFIDELVPKEDGS